MGHGWWACRRSGSAADGGVFVAKSEIVLLDFIGRPIESNALVDALKPLGEKEFPSRLGFMGKNEGAGAGAVFDGVL